MVIKEGKPLVKIGELKIDKTKDYHKNQVKTLESNGYILVKTFETYGECFYDIAESEDN